MIILPENPARFDRLDDINEQYWFPNLVNISQSQMENCKTKMETAKLINMRHEIKSAVHMWPCHYWPNDNYCLDVEQINSIMQTGNIYNNINQGHVEVIMNGSLVCITLISPVSPLEISAGLKTD